MNESYDSRGRAVAQVRQITRPESSRNVLRI